MNQAIHQIGFFDSANSYKKSSYSFDITECITDSNVISMKQFTRSAFLIAQILIKSRYSFDITECDTDSNGDSFNMLPMSSGFTQNTNYVKF